MNDLARDVAVVEGLWVGKYLKVEVKDEEQLFAVETKKFSDDFVGFRRFAEVTDDHSMFNLKILNNYPSTST